MESDTESGFKLSVFFLICCSKCLVKDDIVFCKYGYVFRILIKEKVIKKSHFVLYKMGPFVFETKTY